MNKIRIMYAMGGVMNRAGAESMTMQYMRQLRKDERFEFSFVVHGNVKGDFDDEILSYGIPIYHVPVRGKHPFSYSTNVKKILKEHPVDIIHCDMDTSCGYFLKIAKDCGIPVRIAHSHSTDYLNKNFIRKAVAIQSKNEIRTVATERFACSYKAGKWLFPNDEFTVVNNAIDLKPYIPNRITREKKRIELGIPEDTFVLGHIGRFSPPKNHVGLLKIYAELKKKRKNTKLILVGTGELLDVIRELARNLEIEKDVLFLGVRSDIPELFQAIDTFVMPSNWEGLPVAGIEAQAAGLPCIFSDAVTSEVCMTDFAKRLPKNNIDLWVDMLKNMQKKRNAVESHKSLREHGYDIETEAEKMANLYVKAYLNSEK